MNPSFYDRYWSASHPPPDSDPTTPARRAKLIDALRKHGISPSCTILDLGCGRGDFVRFLVESGFSASGVDISAEAINSAKERAPKCTFSVLNEDQTIPHDSGKYDAVWSTEVLEHVFDIHQHLSEVNRVLKDQGIYILTTPFHGRLKNSLIALTKFDSHFDPEGGHIRFFDRAGLQRCLTKANLAPITWTGIGRFWPIYRTWFVVAKKVGPAPMGGKS